MKAELWMIGKTAFPYLAEGMAIYEKRLAHYLSFKMVVLPDVKNSSGLSPGVLKVKEAEIVLSRLRKEDFFVLLDEKGKQFTSAEFAAFLEQQQQLHATRKVVFLIGGAWGVAPELYHRADFQLSLSKMTFSHQMIRLFFLEQLYRAMTILRGEPYHNN